MFKIFTIKYLIKWTLPFQQMLFSIVNITPSINALTIHARLRLKYTYKEHQNYTVYCYQNNGSMFYLIKSNK